MAFGGATSLVADIHSDYAKLAENQGATRPASRSHWFPMSLSADSTGSSLLSAVSAPSTGNLVLSARSLRVKSNDSVAERRWFYQMTMLPGNLAIMLTSRELPVSPQLTRIGPVAQSSQLSASFFRDCVGSAQAIKWCSGLVMATSCP